MSRVKLLLDHDARSGVLTITAAELRPPLRRYDVGGRELYILGSPICGGQRDDKAVTRAWSQSSSIDEFARGLDGNFLVVIHDEKNKTLEIVSDRFASHGFYFSQSAGGRLTGSLSLSELVSQLSGFVPDATAFVEFLHFRRVFGEKTYDRRCIFLRSASILEHGPAGHRVRQYWKPCYDAPKLGLKSGADAIAEGLRQTMRANMDGADAGGRAALFLSGGLDSRALLMAADEKPLCVTTCAAYNNEAMVAEEVAKAAGAPFTFVEQPRVGYDEHIADAVYYGGGQHLLTEAHFIDYGPLLSSRADRFFLGLGLDIFFGGLYLPKRPVGWLGRDTLHSELDVLDEDPTDAFIAGVKYRLKTSNPWDVIKPDQREDLQDAMRHSIADIAERGRALGASDYDLWEYLHLHNLSRHYSFLMIKSINHWSECRVPALCNDLFDAAIALPAKLKVNSGAYLTALNALSPSLMKIRNANTNIMAGMPLRRQSLLRAARIAANKLGAGLRVSPGISDRSWPAPREILKESPALSAAVKALPKSERLDALGFVDLGAVGRKVEDHLDGRRDESLLLLLLVTLDEFVRQVR